MKKITPQLYFHKHFNQEGHDGMNDWSFTLIDKGGDLVSVRKRGSFWQYRLNTFAPHGVNSRTVNTVVVYGTGFIHTFSKQK